MRSWLSWSRAKRFGDNSQLFIKGNEVVEVKPGVWKWMKGVRVRQKVQERYFRERKL